MSNIDTSKNSKGRSLYPKYVKDKKGNDVIVNNPKEEMEVTGAKANKENKDTSNSQTQTSQGAAQGSQQPWGNQS